MKKRKSSWQAKVSMLRILLCLSVLHIHVYVTANLITIPKDSEVLIGSLTFFNCSSNSSSSKIQWFHYGIGTKDDRRIIYGYGQFYRSFVNRSRIEGNEAAGESNLVIEQVSIEDAGKFECQDDMGRGSSGFAQLSVLEANPVCEWKIENRQETGSGGESTKKLLHLNCTVDFRGNNPPNMTWKQSGEAISQGVTTVNVSPSRVTYMLETSDDFEGKSFQCETTKSVTTQYTCSSDFIDPSKGKNGPVTVPLVIGLIVAVVVVIVVAAMCIRRRRAYLRKKQFEPPPANESKPSEIKSTPTPDVQRREGQHFKSVESTPSSFEQILNKWKGLDAATQQNKKQEKDKRSQQKRQDAVKEDDEEEEVPQPKKSVNDAEVGNRGDVMASDKQGEDSNSETIRLLTKGRVSEQEIQRTPGDTDLENAPLVKSENTLDDQSTAGEEQSISQDHSSGQSAVQSDINIQLKDEPR